MTIRELSGRTLGRPFFAFLGLCALSLLLAQSARAQLEDGDYEFWYYYICSMDPYTCAQLTPPWEIQPPEVADPEDTDRPYFPRYGDINGDGRSDMCITGDSSRRVQDFMLRSNANEFTIVPYASMSSTMRSACQTWPASSTAVSRVDLKGNGYFDFIIDALDGTRSIIVGTSQAGTIPTHAMTFDVADMDAAEQIEAIVENPGDALAAYDSTITVWVEYWVPYWSCNIDYTWCDYWYFPYWVQVTYPGSILFDPIAQDFVTANRDLLELGRPEQCPQCYRDALTELLAASPDLMSASTDGGGLDAEDLWIIGVATVANPIPGDEVLVAAGAAAVGAGYLAIAAYNALMNNGDTDIGPTVDISGVSTPAPAPPPPDPDDYNYSSTGEVKRTHPATEAGHRAAIRDLRRNMRLKGMEVPRGHAAHHIVPFRHLENGVGAQLRALLNKHNIHVNSAVNGVAAPVRAYPGNPAVSHGALHGRQALQRVYERLLAGEQSGGGMGVQRALRQVAREMHNGTFTW